MFTLRNMLHAWGVLMVRKWQAVRSRRYTMFANHSIDMDGYTLHYIDNKVTIPVRIKEDV